MYLLRRLWGPWKKKRFAPLFFFFECFVLFEQTVFFSNENSVKKSADREYIFIWRLQARRVEKLKGIDAIFDSVERGEKIVE